MARVEKPIVARTLGTAFLAICVLFVWFTYAVFTKQFSDYDLVTLKASKVGLQLPARADVKIRGVIVGEVQEAKVTAEGVDLILGLYPHETDTIPKNVTAEILPKTLFGEKYVSLLVPENPSSTSIEAGDIIKRSSVAIEVEEVLSDIYPLLRTVQPEQLNYTLTALANALEGRGEVLGESLETLDDYLRRLDPQLPQLIEDVKLLGQTSAVYAQVVPDIARTLRNTVITGNTFVSQEAKIQALFEDIAAFSSTTRDFLEANGDNIIRLGELGQATLPLLGRYAPEYPCLFKAITGAIPRETAVFRGRKLHIILELLPKQPRGYTASEAPRYDEKAGPFPYCDLLDSAGSGRFNQNNLFPDALVRPMKDGVNYPLAKRTAPLYDLTSGYAGTAAEKDVVAAILARVNGGSADDVPDIATLLFGPLARGAEVHLR
ncbi:MAG TPA: MCE family protein [Nocardioidaceae bacterium]|nr:MCE family protein [Nocardioidaceae bacterium]